MASAKKCDRCGSYYDLIEQQPCKMIILKYNSMKTEDFDLCPDCMVELYNWIEGKEFENENGYDRDSNV